MAPQRDIRRDDLTGEGNPEKIKILMYHLIAGDESLCHNQGDLCVHPDRFRSQLGLLDRWGFTPITFNDYRLFLEGELNLPRKPVIITFDDGYEAVHANAFPLLQEFGMKAVVFSLGDRKIRSSIWDIPLGIPSLPLMSDEQILELHRSGFEIGSHSLTHPKLPALSREPAWDEISRSRILLEFLLNGPVRSFAYPYGLLNESAKRMVEDAGYTIGCATYTGPPVFGKDLFEARRILIRGTTDTAGFAARMLLPYQYYAWGRWQIKRLLAKGTADRARAIISDPSEIIKRAGKAESGR